MLLFIAMLGGLLLMMGHHSRGESLFYYFRLEDQIPENHLLRLIDRHVNFDFVRAKLKDSYSVREANSGASPSTPASQRGNVPMPWPRHQHSPSRSALGGRWKPSSPS